MGHKRRILVSSLVAVMVLGVAALPSIAAPQKIFSLNMPSSISSSGTGISISAVIRNETPTGNSSINSLTITAAAPTGFLITGATAPSGTVTIASDGQSIAISNIAPIKNGQSYTVALTVTVPATSNCGSITWTAAAWTGSSFSGDTFALLSSLSNLTTGLAAGCVLQFVPGRTPADAVKGTTITSVAADPTGAKVQVELVNSSSTVASWFKGSVTLATATGTTGLGTVSGSTATASGGIATFGSLSIDKIGDYLLAASSGSLTSASSPSFRIYGAGIACQGTSGEIAGGDPATTTTLNRTDNGPNGDGTGCVQVPYTLAPDTDNVVLLKDQAIVDQQHATFELVITWGTPPGDYNALGGFNVSVFDPDGIENSEDEYTPANCTFVDGVAQPPLVDAVQHWCFAGSVIQGSGSDLQATETFLGSGDPTIRYK